MYVGGTFQARLRNNPVSNAPSALHSSLALRLAINGHAGLLGKQASCTESISADAKPLSSVHAAEQRHAAHGPLGLVIFSAQAEGGDEVVAAPRLDAVAGRLVDAGAAPVLGLGAGSGRGQRGHELWSGAAWQHSFTCAGRGHAQQRHTLHTWQESAHVTPPSSAAPARP